MQRGGSKQDYEITTVRLTPEQKEWIDSKPVNFSALVRSLVDEARENDRIDSVALLEGILAERRLLESRCERLEELLEAEEAVESAGIDPALHGTGDSDE